MFLRSVYESLREAPAPINRLEKLIAEVGNLATQLVNNRDTGNPPDADIARTLQRIGVVVTVLAVEGTGEYTYSGG